MQESTKKSLMLAVFSFSFSMLCTGLKADDFSDILSRYGKPIEKTEFESRRKIIWKYPKHEFIFINGVLQTETSPQVQYVALAPKKPEQSKSASTAVLTPLTPDEELMRNVFSEMQKNTNQTTPKTGREANQIRAPKIPALPLTPIDEEEEEEEG